MECILITGGTGLIGRHLTKLLSGEGYEVIHLSRSPSKGSVKTFTWNIDTKEIDDDAIAAADHIIHLAGADLSARRWTKEYKEEIISSRVEGALLIRDSMLRIPNHVKSFISASGIGYYGDRGDEWLTEDAEPGDNFVSSICIEWEKAAHSFEKINKRVVILRTGIVLSKDGGALPPLMNPIRYGVAPIFGDGKQFYSWIHIDDLCGMYLHAIKNETVRGVYNGVAPGPQRYEDLMDIIAKNMKKRKLNVRVPIPFLKIIMGEFIGALADSDRCTSKKIEESGFRFKFEELDGALKNIIQS
jgi:uncharacterized protein (TIGR01777 family)